MEIFGIGPLELVLIVLVAIIVLGPKEMMTSAQKAATWLKKLRKSDIWETTKEVMDIPNQVMKETGLDKEIHEIQSLTNKTFSQSAWTPNTLLPKEKAPAEKVEEPPTASQENTGESDEQSSHDRP
jgi:Sec-independent protein translocase protein TatA